MSFLGLDIGTSGCKAAVFDERGRLIALAARDYPVRQEQPGWAELDSQRVGDACLDVIREVAARTGPDPVQALAISSQGEAFTVLDREGHLLVDAMVSSDQRAASLVEDWTLRFGVERLYEKTGHTAHPMFSVFKLLWLRGNRPDIWKRAARFLCFEDYLHHRLGVDPAIGWPLAGRTMLFDVRRHVWDREILEEVGVRPEQLAQPMESGSVAGIIPSGIARSLNLPPGVQVVCGGHDQVCAALGAGTVGAGHATLTTGTVECITVAFPEPILQPVLRDANLCTYAHAGPGLYASVAYNLTGGNLLRWFRDQWAAAEQAEATNRGVDSYDLLLDALPAQPSRLLALPYFTASGTPYFDAKTPGAILGLRLDTKRGDVLLALLEGLAFELRLNTAILETAGVPIDEIHAVGGGARNRRWVQLKADVLNRPISRPKVSEAGCLGAALLACAALTGRRPIQMLSEWVTIQDSIEPEPARAAFYAERFGAYQEAYSSLRALAARIC